ncbi:tetratricopeptide repeat protein [Dysgonomonas sp. HDW5B]|uniref:tetratricopeptide repeat protein n=1 Tax=Dysgonomonas sp. HDW5B TaxID=2714927 RepID=UPI00140971B6|nr:tetratricopeptide repeat protein [Dysgonomonas sp. HDW5B]QIK54176.1 tetratricopeptide repeat protein [Dysgonomonas sp. HDW5B]
MKLLLKYLFLMVTGTLLFSCQKDNSQEKLLKQAENNLVIGKPEITLNLLASIQNPEKMDKRSYMQYIVTYVGAKKETKSDITSDTLIFEAQNYFNDTKDYKNSALANYYAGWVFYVNNKLPQSLGSFMYGADAADKSSNYLLAGKSFNNIAYIYYQGHLLDSAISNYKRAFPYYDKLENVSQRKIEILTDIGRSYEGNNKLDSAYVYFQKGLNLAKQTDHKKEERQLYHNLGLTCYGMSEYEKSIEFFHSALAMNTSSESEITQINLYLLNIYNKKQDNKLAKQYADLVILGLPNISYSYTIKEIYAALAEYYKQIGDYKQALEYSELEKNTKEQIEKEKNVPALLEADKSFHLAKKDREVQELKSDVVFFLVVGGVIICIVLVFIFFIWNDSKKGKAEIRECAERYDEIKALLFSMGEKYPKIEAEIKSMLEDD